MKLKKNRYKKIAVFFFLPVLFCCYQQKEGCLDVSATNFDFDADKDCCEEEVCCCTYPTYQLEVLHKLSPEDSLNNFSTGTFYDWPNGEGLFSVEHFSLYISHLAYKNSLTDVTSSNTDSITIEVFENITSNKEITIQDNFALIKPGSFTYNIGEIRSVGSFDVLEFYLGVPAPAQNAIPESFPTDHSLAVQSPILQFSPIEGYITCQLSLKKDTFMLTNPDTFNLYLTDHLVFELDQHKIIENGQDLSSLLRINYLNLFEGIDFAINNNKAISLKLTENLPNALNVIE